MALACVCLVAVQLCGGCGGNCALLLAEAKSNNDRWYSVTDETSGKMYFWNKGTGETTWTKPANAKITRGVKYHAKNSRKNRNIGAPPAQGSSAAADATGTAAAGEGAAESASKTSEHANEKEGEGANTNSEFELLDDEGDEIPPPPPAVSYVLVAAGVAALLVVVVALVFNSRKDAALVKDIYKTE